LPIQSDPLFSRWSFYCHSNEKNVSVLLKKLAVLAIYLPHPVRYRPETHRPPSTVQHSHYRYATCSSVLTCRAECHFAKIVVDPDAPILQVLPHSIPLSQGIGASFSVHFWATHPMPVARSASSAVTSAMPIYAAATTNGPRVHICLPRFPFNAV
jgi:hypothetical protein